MPFLAAPTSLKDCWPTFDGPGLLGFEVDALVWRTPPTGTLSQATAKSSSAPEPGGSAIRQRMLGDVVPAWHFRSSSVSLI